MNVEDRVSAVMFANVEEYERRKTAGHGCTAYVLCRLVQKSLPSRQSVLRRWASEWTLALGQSVSVNCDVHAHSITW